MDPRKVSAQWLRTTVFQEEAIQPKAPRPAERLPSLLLAARSLENGPRQRWQSKETVFLKQARLLANYEDDYDYQGSAIHYYPTYQDLTAPQLRGYFSWRTRLRGGELQKTSLTFAFLYIYELLNQVGAAGPLDGYQKLAAFRDGYGQIDQGILPYLNRWMADYVVYYNLDPTLLSGPSPIHRDSAIAVLERVQEAEPQAVMEAVSGLSSWLDRSRFYREHQADMDAVVLQALRRVSAYCAAHHKRTMTEQYFGPVLLQQYWIFQSAVFCNPLKRKNYSYDAGGQRVYACENGIWTLRARDPTHSGDRLGTLLKTIDCVMRREFGYGHPVKLGLSTKWVLQIIQEETERRLAQNRAAEERRITIDYSQLGQIRRDAAITQEKLTVEEEMPEEDVPELRTIPEPPQPSGGGDCPLAPQELRLLQCLLYGGDTGWVQAQGQLLSVLADGINETLYDLFSDCVLDGECQLIEDYIDDLKEMVRP